MVDINEQQLDRADCCGARDDVDVGSGPLLAEPGLEELFRRTDFVGIVPVQNMPGRISELAVAEMVRTG